ncbi:hypothetical protein SETIT_2G280300v2 [Setaria italica]|uniref:AP2/ERF domain-containing protein n=1 Tax=Setaria italica TaxID=4555 RepID=A0A368Q4F3_SETIT|nr:hypothetical protein SETIT_2G280300v2 [Setaria italica]
MEASSVGLKSLSGAPTVAQLPCKLHPRPYQDASSFPLLSSPALPALCTLLQPAITYKYAPANPPFTTQIHWRYNSSNAKETKTSTESQPSTKMCRIKEEMVGESASPCSSPSTSSDQQTVWTSPPKRPAGRTKFRETGTPCSAASGAAATPGGGLWLGTFDAAESAARAHDAAMLATAGAGAEDAHGATVRGHRLLRRQRRRSATLELLGLGRCTQ